MTTEWQVRTFMTEGMKTISKFTRYVILRIAVRVQLHLEIERGWQNYRMLLTTEADGRTRMTSYETSFNSRASIIATTVRTVLLIGVANFWSNSVCDWCETGIKWCVERERKRSRKSNWKEVRREENRSKSIRNLRKKGEERLNQKRQEVICRRRYN